MTRSTRQQGFAVGYPKSFGFDRNDCSSIGDPAVDGVRADDAGDEIQLLGPSPMEPDGTALIRACFERPST